MRFIPLQQRCTRLLGNHEGFCGIVQICRNRTRSAALVLVSLIIVMYSGFQIMYMPVEMNICQDPSKSKDSYLQNIDDNITIVTMYLNIGTFKKTSFFLFSKESYATDHYKNWLFSWGKLNNRVIAFFDDDDFIEQFRIKRAHLPDSFTKIVRISKDQLSAFKYKKQVEEINQHPSFSLSYPPDYTCTMDAKYDALEMALKMDDIKTSYVAWMDIGLFRRLQEEDPPFTLKVPSDFNSSKLGFSEVTSRKWLSQLTPREIYEKNVVWVAGGFVLGVKKVISEFITAYRNTARELLAQGLADTDQQVIASMYSPDMASKQKIDIMTYSCPRGSFSLYGHAYLYFCLPYICKASAECKTRSQKNPENYNHIHISSRHS
ncbi:unnamed protein product [Lymnaea stagnalis]|uniref:Uncharacterized protein n=1 Tax=Lymnaea stagnalis TaxID=6523 RepID=A0AAV2H231_LYMST